MQARNKRALKILGVVVLGAMVWHAVTEPPRIKPTYSSAAEEAAAMKAQRTPEEAEQAFKKCQALRRYAAARGDIPQEPDWYRDKWCKGS
jgi:type II secretory pathway component PulM